LDELYCLSRGVAEVEVAGARDLSVEAGDGHMGFGVVIHGQQTWEEAAGEEAAGGSDTESRVQILVVPGRSPVGVGEVVEMVNS
jgi:hypothetical protein